MKSLIFSFFMLTCSLAFSQHVPLKGSVSDGKTALPEAMPGASALRARAAAKAA